MPRLIKKRNNKTGKPPGSLIFIGSKKSEETKIKIINYDEINYKEVSVKNPNECASYKSATGVTWINIDGLHDTKVIERIGEIFSIHPLTLEDILNTDHRPAIEDYGNYLYIALKMPNYNEQDMAVALEQISIIWFQSYIITFQEIEGDEFTPLIGRIKSSKGKIRKYGADFLAYSILDTIIDNYLNLIEHISEDIEGIENKLIKYPSNVNLNSIYNLKREIMFLRKSVFPVREIIQFLVKSDSDLITNQISLYLKDVYDHVIHTIEVIDNFRELLSEMFNIYMSNISNRLNEVMRILTVISTIFIPLTFIVGVYGMNFEYMPELKYEYGYPIVMILMFILGMVMFIYFKRKKWF